MKMHPVTKVIAAAFCYIVGMRFTLKELVKDYESTEYFVQENGTTFTSLVLALWPITLIILLLHKEK